LIPQDCRPSFERVLLLNLLGSRENNLDHLQGLLDETVLFNRALSPAEIQQVRNATRGP